ncbi:MAG: ricin-type beta-trefoil lectin domain protein [Mycobacteriales bacterium]
MSPFETPRRWAGVAVLAAAAATLVSLSVQPARAAGETVNIWLTTTNDQGGRNVTRGLQQQAPIAFGTGGSAGQTITVDENTTYQRFVGAGASFTDTAAWLMNSSGALSASTRASVMQKLFDPVNGIGLDFLRNPMGASDLARYNYSFDDMPAGQTDPTLAHFSISHDLADILPLTRQAEQLNPDLKVMAVPWSAPAWMKDNDNLIDQGWLESQYYGAYAQYFVKYLQAYQAQGVHIDYVSAQNEPTCCGAGTSYASMNWNGSGLDYFSVNDLLPAFHAAGLNTKLLVLDYNWSNYDDLGSVPMADATLRNDPLFGGIAWHGYGGDPTMQTTIHNQYPNADAYDTEHSGGTWIGNQQNEDMHNIIDYTRNWGRTVTKWSLAVDQNMGPHAGGCGTCTGLITVHNGDSRSGQVDYTVEYYDMGQLTKFVRPGAVRIASTANSTVPNVAWKNPDGSKALLAYNGTGGTQSLKVNWGGESFVYNLPAATSATFTWGGSQSGGGGGATGQITGLAGKCVDVAGASSANGTQVQLYTCNGTGAQQWTVGTDGTVRALGRCLDVSGAGTANGTRVQLYDCNGSGAQQWTFTSGHDLVNPQANRCLDVTGNTSADGTPLQIWDCTGAANQKWTIPTSG